MKMDADDSFETLFYICQTHGVVSQKSAMMNVIIVHLLDNT
jgi:hypothetical protein